MADSSSADKSSVARSPNHLTVSRHLWAHDNNRMSHASGALFLSPKGSRRAYSSSNTSLLSAGGADEGERVGSGAGGLSSLADAAGLLGGAGGVTPHRRRRLILKAVHRSWPTSSSASSAAAAGVGCAYIRTLRPRSVSVWIVLVMESCAFKIAKNAITVLSMERYSTKHNRRFENRTITGNRFKVHLDKEIVMDT